MHTSISFIFYALVLVMTFSCQQSAEIEDINGKDVSIISDQHHFTALHDEQKCKTCHEVIYQEWSASIHARSSFFQDPIHQAVVKAYQKSKAKAGKPVDYHCANCHTPMANNKNELMKAKALLDINNPTHIEGVSCRSCHSMVGIKKHKNFDRPIYAKDSFVYSSRANKNAPHPVKVYPFNNKDQVCLSCHAHKHNGRNVPICLMAGENGEYESGKSGSCIDCHMAEVSGPPAVSSAQKSHTSHRFMGAHGNPNLLSDAVGIDEVNIQNDELSFSLSNYSGHSFPSTQPMRQAAIIVQAYNEKNKIIWSNQDNLNHKDKTLLMVALADKDNNYPVPPWKSHKRLFDTRLNVGESRHYHFTLPVGTKKIIVKILYRLLAPNVAKDFGLSADYSSWKKVKEACFGPEGTTSDCR